MNLKTDYKKFEPIGDKVLLVIPREDVNEMIATEGGILVPKSEDRKNNPLQEFYVQAVGPACKTVRAGDTVLYNVHNSPPIPVGDVELRFAQEEHIFCVTHRGARVASINVVEP